MVIHSVRKQFAIKNPNSILNPKGIPILYYPSNWEGRWVYHPRVIEKKGIYYLFYTGKSGVNSLKGKSFQRRHDIGLAISSDFKIWRRVSNNPILSASGDKKKWDSDLVSHAFILDTKREKDQYVMFYSGSRKGEWLESIGIALSDDLLSWHKYPKPVLKKGDFWWESNHVSRCCVIKSEDGYFYMFYAGHNGVCERIGVARSRDLINWDKISKDPIIDIGEKGSWDDTFVSDPTVLKIRNYYIMSYTGHHNSTGCTGFAYSKDLINWRKFSLNPVLEPGKKESWDQEETARADFVNLQNKYYLFYSGRKGLNYSIGYAEVDIENVMKVINKAGN